MVRRGYSVFGTLRLLPVLRVRAFGDANENGLALMLSIALGCVGQPPIDYKGPLANEAAAARASGAGWFCDSTGTLPGTKTSGPLLKCQGTQGDTQVAVLSEGSDTVLAIARELRSSPTPAREVFDKWRSGLGTSDANGVAWCDPGAMSEARVWVAEGQYTVLGVDTVRGRVNLSTTLGKPYCEVSLTGGP